MSQFSLTPIEKHYAVNAQILSAFEHCLSQHQYLNAYTVGLSFAETALLEIPKHGYYNSPRHERERMASALEAVRVLTDLIGIKRDASLAVYTESMDTTRLDKLHRLALEQVQQASQDQYEDSRRQAEQELSQMDSWVQVCEPLVTCSDSWASVICPDSSTALPIQNERAYTVGNDNDDYVHVDKVREEKKRKSSLPSRIMIGVGLKKTLSSSSSSKRQSSSSSSGSYRQASPVTVPLDSNVEDMLISPPSMSGQRASSKSINSSSRPPPYPESARPPLARHTPAQESALSIPPELLKTPSLQLEQASLTRTPSQMSNQDLQLGKALYLSGLDLLNNASLRSIDVPPSDNIEMDDESQKGLSTILAQMYHEDFDQLRNDGRIRINFCNTHQGRVPGSTNGCTVIAPLLCMHHLLETPHTITLPDPGLPDAILQHVMDEETPHILQELRDSLGLSQHAFLIPSDAHEYLLDRGYLLHSQFVTVTGGNILNEDHLGTFINLLKGTERRLAACFFFHEHVVAILQLQRDRNGKNPTIWYDMIDGLPSSEFMQKTHESKHDMARRIALTDSQEFMAEAFVPKTARTRCLDGVALAACLRWYACSKFTPENLHYIDTYPWDDYNTDFDPRVFQAFIWGSVNESQ
jgi:hypothetical protein